MAVTVNGNPKPFTCTVCQRGFVSVDKLNHHEHKEHGVPRKLSLNMPAVQASLRPGTNTSDTPTPTRVIGELDALSGMPRDVGDLPMSSMLADYNLTPSVFDQDFRMSIGNIAEKGVRVSRRSSPRISSATRLTVTKEGPSSSSGGPSSTSGFANYSTLPKSPGTFFLTHINAAGQYVSSPVLPVPGSPLMASLNNMNMPFAFPTSPISMVRSGGGLLFPPSIPFPVQPPIDPLTNQLQALWANSTLEEMRDSSTPITENSSTDEKDKKKKKSGKRKANEIDASDCETRSESMSIHSGISVTATRRARPILETDDLALADKRMRNRIAAEKCRIKRKDKQKTLEVENDELKEKIRQLERKVAELSRVSQEVVRKLQNENVILRAENSNYQKLLSLGTGHSGGEQQPSTAGFPIILKSDASGAPP